MKKPARLPFYAWCPRLTRSNSRSGGIRGGQQGVGFGAPPGHLTPCFPRPFRCALHPVASASAWAAFLPWTPQILKDLLCSRQERGPWVRPGPLRFLTELFSRCWSTRPRQTITWGEELRCCQPSVLEGDTTAGDSGGARAAFWCSQNSRWRSVLQLQYSTFWGTNR